SFHLALWLARSAVVNRNNSKLLQDPHPPYSCFSREFLQGPFQVFGAGSLLEYGSKLLLQCGICNPIKFRRLQISQVLSVDYSMGRSPGGELPHAVVGVVVERCVLAVVWFVGGDDTSQAGAKLI